MRQRCATIQRPSLLLVLAFLGQLVAHAPTAPGVSMLLSLCSPHISLRQRSLAAFMAAPMPLSAGPLIATWAIILILQPQLPVLLPGLSRNLLSQHQQWQWQQPLLLLKSFATRLSPGQLFAAVPAAAGACASLLPVRLVQTASAALKFLVPSSPAVQLLLLGVVVAWLVAELAFYCIWFRPSYSRWNARCNADRSQAAQSIDECMGLFKRFMRFSRAQPCQPEFLRQYLSMWFRGAAAADIKRGNMEELFAYGFFYRTRQQMTDIGLGHLPSEMISEFEDVFNCNFSPGYTPGLKFMSHLWEDLRVHWRPLGFYVAMELLAVFAGLCMRAMGFKKQQLGHLHYYTRGIANSTTTTTTNSTPSHTTQEEQQQQPIVFIHGVAGLVLYLPLLARLAASKAPLLVLDMKHVGLRISPTIPSVDSLAASLAAALTHHNLPPALVMAHSYGTLVAGRLLRLQRSAVAKVLFIDPVCFGMFMPRLLHGFFYRPLAISVRKPLSSAFNLLLSLVSKDIHLAATFARNFYWSDLNLWPEDLPAGSCVVLSGGDALVASEDIGIMLRGSGNLEVLYKPDLIHGGFLLDHSTRSQVLAQKTLAGAVLDAAAAAGDAAAAAAAQLTSVPGAASIGAAAAAVGAAASTAASAVLPCEASSSESADTPMELSSFALHMAAGQGDRVASQQPAACADVSAAANTPGAGGNSVACAAAADVAPAHAPAVLLGSRRSSFEQGSFSKSVAAATTLRSSAGSAIYSIDCQAGRGRTGTSFSADGQLKNLGQLDSATAAAAAAATAAAAANGAAALLAAAAAATGPVISSSCSSWLLSSQQFGSSYQGSVRCSGSSNVDSGSQPQGIARRYTVH